MKAYKAIIYDIDGTVLNTLNMNMYPLMRIIEEETKVKLTFEEVLRYAPYPGMKVMEELHIQNKEEVYARWVRYVNEYEDGATLYDGFSEVFQAFEGKMIQAVVSAKTKEQYELDFVTKGLDRFMQCAILAKDTQKHKPDPEPLLECLKRLQINAEDAIYIGDALSDYQACEAAHMAFGYATWGSVSAQGITSPTYTFDHPLDLLTLLENV